MTDPTATPFLETVLWLTDDRRPGVVDPHEIGESMLQLLRDYVERLLRFRSSEVSRPWIDVRFSEFVADPLSAVEHKTDSEHIAPRS